MSPVRQLGDTLDKAFVLLSCSLVASRARRGRSRALLSDLGRISQQSLSWWRPYARPYANANGETNFRQPFHRSYARYR